MEAVLVHLAPGQTRLANYNPRPDRVSEPRASLDPLFLVHLLMVSLFLSLSNVWQMMYTKADTMGITQRMTPFMECLKAATVDPHQGITALTLVDLVDTTLEQMQWIRTSLVPPLPPPPPPIQGLPL